MNPGDTVQTRSGFYGVVAVQPQNAPTGYTLVVLNGYCDGFLIPSAELSLV